ncbi:MAG: N-formylglutamate deformylase [Terriglobales bacterium]
MEMHRFLAGSAPLLVSMPHTGTHIPDALLARMTPAAKMLADTDWHLERLYDFLDELGASVLVATHSRYVVDLNRPPDGASLYPGKDTTALAPTDTFAKQPLYLSGSKPEESEIEKRVEVYWKPYHAKLQSALQAIQQKHGYALLWDAHSILSKVPRFFQGTLPDFNLGTADGRSCAPGLGEDLLRTVQDYSAVLNGRFKGGYITRQHGRPNDGVEAVQLELAQVNYMDEESFAYDAAKAAPVQALIRQLLEAAL